MEFTQPKYFSRTSLALISSLILYSLTLGTSPVSAQTTPPAAALSAEARSQGLWYYSLPGYEAINKSGVTGKKIKIAVIDTGINTQAAELQGANIKVRGTFCTTAEGKTFPADGTDPDLHSHGTATTAMIVGNGKAADGGAGTIGVAPNAEILFYALPANVGCSVAHDPIGEAQRDPEGNLVYPPFDIAGMQAIRDGADIVTMSMAGHYSDIFILEALRKKIPVFVATQNPTDTMDEILNGLYPMRYNGTLPIGAVDSTGNPIRSADPETFQPGSDYPVLRMALTGPGGTILTAAGPNGWYPQLSSGTALSTAIAAGTAALLMEKYPKATSNQILQAMVSTTSGEFMENPEILYEDGTSATFYGFGILKPTAALAVDPTQLPDKNPLFIDAFDHPLCVNLNNPEVPVTKWNDCEWSADPNVEWVRRAALPTETPAPSQTGTSDNSVSSTVENSDSSPTQSESHDSSSTDATAVSNDSASNLPLILGGIAGAGLIIVGLVIVFTRSTRNKSHQ